MGCNKLLPQTTSVAAFFMVGRSQKLESEGKWAWKNQLNRGRDDEIIGQEDNTPGKEGLLPIFLEIIHIMAMT